MKKFKCLRCGECCTNFDKSGFPLFEWEAKRFLKLAKENKIKLELKPKDIIFDEISKTNFFPYYVLEKGPCVFLTKTGCKVYSKRALICKSFPLYKSSDKDTDRNYFMFCPKFDLKEFLKEKPEKIFTKEQIKSVKLSDSISKFIEDKIKELKGKEKVKLRSANNYEIEKYPAIPIFEFFNNLGIKKPKAFK